MVLCPVVGFCYGVKRALQKALALAEPGRTFSIGSLIHNPQVVVDLESRGIKAKESLDELQPGILMLIPAHGAPQEVYSLLQARKVRICDLTCPELKRTRSLLFQFNREGYQLIFLGDKGHAEVDSLSSFVSRLELMEDPDSPLAFHLQKKVAIFAQSTQRSEDLERLAHRLEPLVEELRVVDTICEATKKRQQALKQILPEIQALVVVGGKNSANTRRLAEIARTLGKRAFQVERAKEIEAEWFEDLEKVGVASGTSTPVEVVQEVAEVLRSL